jgi:hypothetical protein
MEVKMYSKFNKSLAISNSRKVAQIDPENSEILNVFFSSHEACRKTGIDDSAIRKVCNKKRGSAGGYFWRWYNEYETYENMV